MIELAPSKYQKVIEYPKFDDNLDIRRQLEHFEYDMNCTLVLFAGILCCFAVLDVVNWALNGNDQNIIDWLEPLARFINPILVIILIKVKLK